MKWKYPAKYVFAQTQHLREHMEYWDAIARARWDRNRGDYPQCRRMLAHARSLRITYWPNAWDTLRCKIACGLPARSREQFLSMPQGLQKNFASSLLQEIAR